MNRLILWFLSEWLAKQQIASNDPLAWSFLWKIWKLLHWQKKVNNKLENWLKKSFYCLFNKRVFDLPLLNERSTACGNTKKTQNFMKSHFGGWKHLRGRQIYWRALYNTTSIFVYYKREKRSIRAESLIYHLVQSYTIYFTKGRKMGRVWGVFFCFVLSLKAFRQQKLQK